MMNTLEETKLWDVLGGVPDRRQASGRRFTLQSILAITLGAVLAGRTSLAAVSRWGRRLSRKQLREFGVERKKAPCHATYHYVFKSLDVVALERGLGRWVRTLSAGAKDDHVAMDGKTLRGSRHGECPGVHLLAAYCESLRGVLAELHVPDETNEIAVALHLLKELPLKGKVVTGDAMFTQTNICQEVINGGGDYFFIVKGNQETLRNDIEVAFSKCVSPLGTTAVERGGRVSI